MANEDTHLMLEDTQLELLDAFLMSDRAPGSVGLSDLDGFLTGLVVGPEVILPDEWLLRVWGGETPDFTDIAEGEAMEGIILARYIEIAALLNRGPEGLEPIFWSDLDGKTVIAGDWAEGFFIAIELRPEAWAPLIKDGRARILLTPILALCADADGDTWFPMDEEEETYWHVHAPYMIPASALAIRDFWRDRAIQSSFCPEVREGPKVDRNDTCGCGSGRRHKRCCGAN